MATEKLFYRDAYLRSFTATILACRETAEGFLVELDRTAFYPEGGGQPGDRGTLGDARVLDTQEDGDAVLHRTDRALTPGETVTGTIDWDRRFDLMQQHSGEHMVSGVVHRKFGFDNVGFHMGAEAVTIDFSGVLRWEALLEVEREVNERIWLDAAVKCWYPEREALAELDYRSKKALEWPVRLVEFPGADLCACCGTHVARTGEIGLVKFLSVEKFHSGVRVEMLSGRRAMEYLRLVMEQNRRISQRLSAKMLETAQAVENLAEEAERQKQQKNAMEGRYLAALAERYRDGGDILVRLEGLGADGVRRAAIAIQERCGGRAAVFSGEDGADYKYAVGQPGGNLREWVKAMNGALRGRGGGKPDFVQGSVQAAWAEIEAFFALANSSGS